MKINSKATRKNTGQKMRGKYIGTAADDDDNERCFTEKVEKRGH